MLMDISWKSQKGSLRKNNNDFVAIDVNDRSFTAVIVDASEKGKAPYRLAEYWAKKVLTSYIKNEHDAVMLLLKKIHKTLIPDYLTESASYALIDCDFNNHSGNIVFVGDCRVGISNQCGTNWINEPHIIVNTLPGLDDSYSPVLTRVLKARRFTMPAQVNFTWQVGETLLLCTDGYWRPQIDNQGLHYDDVSVLKVRHSDTGFTIAVESDCDNIYIHQ